LTNFERLYVRENSVFDSLIYLEPVERFKNRSYVMKFRSFGDSTSRLFLAYMRLCMTTGLEMELTKWQ